MALTGSEKVSVLSRNGIPVARSLDELAGTSDYDGLNVIAAGGAAPVTVADLKAGTVPAGRTIPQPGTATAHDAADLNEHFDPAPTYSGPLDLVAGAAVAYGQRALSAAMLGSALYTLRRDSDDTTQSFSSDGTTGDAPLSDIATFLGDGNGFVRTWKDQSGNGVDLGQATAAKQYGWSASGPGDRPVVFMDSTVEAGQSLVTTADVSLAGGAFTVFAIAKLPGNEADPSPFLIGINTGQGDPALQINIAGNPADQIEFFAATGSDNIGGRSNHIAHGITDYALFEIAWTHGSKVVRINGATVTISTDEDTTALSETIAKPMSLGTDDVADIAVQDSRFAELLIYPSLLSSGDRTALREDLAAYYGITLA